MNLEEERKRLLQATAEALRAAWPMVETGRTKESLEANDNPGLCESRVPARKGGRPARTSHNRSSRRA